MHSSISGRMHSSFKRAQLRAPYFPTGRVFTFRNITKRFPGIRPRLSAQVVLSVITIESAISAVPSGLCFGWLPKYRIQPELDRGDFVALPRPAGKTREVQLNLVCGELSQSDSEADAFADLFGSNREPEVI